MDFKRKFKIYENFNKIAKRLKSEGKLNEDNYKKLRQIDENRYSGVILMYIVIAIAFGVFEFDLIYFFILFICMFLTVWGQRRNLNKYCYLHSFGEVTEGEILVVEKMGFLYPNCYTYNIVFSFADSKNNKFKVKQSRLAYDSKFQKVPESGEFVSVHYDIKKPENAIINSLLEYHHNYNIRLNTK